MAQPSSLHETLIFSFWRLCVCVTRIGMAAYIVNYWWSDIQRIQDGWFVCYSAAGVHVRCNNGLSTGAALTADVFRYIGGIGGILITAGLGFLILQSKEALIIIV